MKKRCVLLSKMVALLIALLLLLVPMVAHTSEGDGWISLDSGLQGMQTEPGIVPFNGNSVPFEIGAPEYEGGELIWGDNATIHLCNDGCSVEGSCCYYNSCPPGCPSCMEHRGRQKNVYIRGTATGLVTWEITNHGVFARDEIGISFVPGVGGGYDRLVIGVHDGVTICRDRTIILAVTRDGVTVTVTIQLRACCLPCLLFCPACDGCFNCTVDPCPCTSGLCEECCPCPRIVKSASPTIVNPGDYVEYTIRVTRGIHDGEGFRDISVVDPLHEYLEFVQSSIRVDGVVYPNGFVYEYDADNNVLTISYMELYYCAQDGYVEYVVITFTAKVYKDAPLGPIDNIATLFFEGEGGRNASARIMVEPRGDTRVQVTKVWQGDGSHLHYRPSYITVELRRRGQTEPVATQILNAANNWSHVWSGLPVNDEAGVGIVYDVVERNVPQGYTSGVVMVGTATEGFTATVTNTFNNGVIPPIEGGITNLEVTKNWVGDTPASRPANIQVELLVNGNPLNPPRFLTITPDANGNWVGSFVMPVYDDNDNLIDYSDYSIREINVPRGYTSVVGGRFAPPTPDNNAWTITLTNTLNQGQVGGPLTGDFASTAPLLAGFLFAMSGLLGGTSLRRKLKK